MQPGKGAGVLEPGAPQHGQPESGSGLELSQMSMHVPGSETPGVGVLHHNQHGTGAGVVVPQLSQPEPESGTGREQSQLSKPVPRSGVQ